MADTNAGDNTKLTPRWPRFSLRTLLLLTVLISLFLAWIGSVLVHVRHQRDIVSKLQSLGTDIYNDYQINGDSLNESALPPGPKLVRYFLGDDAFAHVGRVHIYGRLADDDLALLPELPKLKDVGAIGYITDSGMQYVAQVPQLHNLTLYNPSVTADGLACLHAADELEWLTLMGESVNDDMLQHVDKLPNLQHLLLRSPNQVTSAGLKHLAGLTQIRELDFDAPLIDDEGLRHLAHLSTLEILTLNGESITGDGLVYLRGLPRLKELCLRGTVVTDSGLQHLAGLRQLAVLGLGQTKVSDAGLVHLERLNELHLLELSGTEVSDAGLHHIARMDVLGCLFIDSTNVSDDGILGLARRKKLQWFRAGPGVNQSVVTELKRLLPDCRLEVW